jgi:hypothetical protein
MPARKPNQGILSNLISQVQQLKSVGQSPILVSQVPNVTGNPQAAVTGVPLPVRQIQTYKVTAGTQQSITVSWLENPQDLNLSQFKIWLKGYKNSSNPVLMASSLHSPVTFLADTTDETVQVIVQSAGNRAELSLGSCPTASVALSNSGPGTFGDGAPTPTTPFGGGSVSGTPLVLIGSRVNESAISGAAAEYLSFLIPAGAVNALGTTWKVNFKLGPSSVGNFKLLNAVMRSTLPDQLGFVDTTQITWNGLSSATFTSPSLDYFSDTFTFTIDGTKDIYIFLRVDPTTAVTALFADYDETAIRFFSADLNAGTDHYDIDAALSASIRTSLFAQSCGLQSIKVV